MTIQECSKLVAIIQEYYRNFYKDYGKEENLKMINAWHFILSDFEYGEISAGLKIFLTNDTKGFPPVPGQLIDKVRKATDNTMTEQEAWTIARKAINCPRDEVVERFNKLPTEIKKIVASPQTLIEWGLTDTEHLTTVIASNFMRSYRSEVARKKEYIPQEIKELLESKNNKLLEKEK
jgi:hypothetical protein